MLSNINCLFLWHVVNRAKFTRVWWELSPGNCQSTPCVPVLTHTFPREPLLSLLIYISTLAALGNSWCFVNQSYKQWHLCMCLSDIYQSTFTTAPKSPWEFKHPIGSCIQQARREFPFRETVHLLLPAPRFQNNTRNLSEIVMCDTLAVQQGKQGPGWPEFLEKFPASVVC